MIYYKDYDLYKTAQAHNLGGIEYLFLVPRDSSEVERLIGERMGRQRTHLDAGRPSCGSVFRKFDRRIMRLLRGVHHGGQPTLRRPLTGFPILAMLHTRTSSSSYA